MTTWHTTFGLSALVTLGFFVSAAAAEVTSLRIETTTGEALGDVVPVFLGIDVASFKAKRNYAGGVSVNVTPLPLGWFYHLEFAPPEGEILAPGTYAGAGPLPQGDPSSPRFQVWGVGCDSPEGSFEVMQVAYGSGDEVTNFWATFRMTCRANDTWVVGEIRFAAEVPLALLAPSRATVIEDQDLVVSVTASSTPPGPIILTAEGLPEGADFVDHGDATGTLQWKPRVSQHGPHTLALVAKDAIERTDRVLIRIQVTVPNDDVVNATVVETLPFSATSDPLGATSAPDDPPCIPGAPTVWYRMRLNRETKIQIRTPGGAGVYSGGPSALIDVACGRPIVQFTAAAGEDYLIVTAPSDPEVRTILIDMVPPPPANDDFDDATPVTTLPFSDSLDTRGATGATDDPICDGQCGTVWYRYTPEENTAIGLTTWGSDYDPIVFVYQGTRGALELIGDLRDPSYRLAVAGGTTYHFMVMNSTFDLTGGLLNFSLTDQPPFSLALAVEPVAVMDKPTGVITVRGEVICSMPAQVYVTIGLERYLAQRNLHANGILALTCAERSPFEIGVQTYSASRFGDYYPPGQYLASASAFGFDTSRHEPASGSVYQAPLLVRGGP